MTRDEIAVASAELLRRREVRRDLVSWARCVGFEPAKHHRLILDRLGRVARGEIKRLAIFCPPGAGKSFYCSVLFPPWFLANNPNKSIIAASHSMELAEKWGRRIRGLVAEHGTTLGVSLSAESQAAGRWALSNGSDYLAVGAGSGVTGFRGDGILIDDPVRGFEDSASKGARDKLFDWYKSDLVTRLRPGGWVVLVMTRWSEDDLAARALAEEEWEVVSLPAEAEAGDLLGREVGELLWSDDPQYDYASFLRHEKATQLPRNWSALFCCRPAPESGDYWKDEWFRPYQVPPPRETLNIYIGADFALSSGTGDWTVFCVVGCDPEDNLWLLHVWRKQADSATSVDALLDICRDYKPHVVAQESGSIARGIGPWLRNRMDERKIWVATEEFAARGDKAVRASSMRGRVAAKGIFYPAGAEWWPDFRAELLSFPSAAHDDCTDLGRVGFLLGKMGGRRPAREAATKVAVHGAWLNQRNARRLCPRQRAHASVEGSHLVAPTIRRNDMSINRTNAPQHRHPGCARITRSNASATWSSSRRTHAPRWRQTARSQVGCKPGVAPRCRY